jgi:large subunit ribosomal protein L16
MGSGKGSPELWVAEVRAGKIIYEMTGVTREVALSALALAAAKLPIKTKFIARQGNLLD